MTIKSCGFTMPLLNTTNHDYISKLVEQASSSSNGKNELSNDVTRPTLAVPDAPKRKDSSFSQIKFSLKEPSDRHNI